MDHDWRPRLPRHVLLGGAVVAAIALGMLAPLSATSADSQAKRTEKRRPKTQVTVAVPGREATSLGARLTQAGAATPKPVQWPQSASATVQVSSSLAATRRG